MAKRFVSALLSQIDWKLNSSRSSIRETVFVDCSQSSRTRAVGDACLARAPPARQA